MEQATVDSETIVQENVQLRRQLAEIRTKVGQYQSLACGLCIDDMFEYLVIACTSAMNDKIKDALKCSADAYRRISEKDEILHQILEHFEGKTIREKKDKLRDFLKENPAYRTQDSKLLLQRLKLKNKYGDFFEARELPQTPIKDAIDEFNAQEGEENLLI